MFYRITINNPSIKPLITAYIIIDNDFQDIEFTR